MALSPAQEYIQGQLAGTTREVVVIRETLSYSEQEYLNILLLFKNTLLMKS